MTYSYSWDETVPAGTDNISLGDDVIRQLKVSIRERLGGLWTSGLGVPFYADTAPVGWTLLNTLDDKLLYITKGSAAGGQTGGGVHSTGSWTISGLVVDSHVLTVGEMPTHTHTKLVIGSTGAPYQGYYLGSNPIGTGDSSTAGGGGGHSHTASQNGTWRPQAYTAIICQKD